MWWWGQVIEFMVGVLVGSVATLIVILYSILLAAQKRL